MRCEAREIKLGPSERREDLGVERKGVSLKVKGVFSAIQGIPTWLERKDMSYQNKEGHGNS